VGAPSTQRLGNSSPANMSRSPTPRNLRRSGQVSPRCHEWVKVSPSGGGVGGGVHGSYALAPTMAEAIVEVETRVSSASSQGTHFCLDKERRLR